MRRSFAALVLVPFAVCGCSEKKGSSSGSGSTSASAAPSAVASAAKKVGPPCKDDTNKRLSPTTGKVTSCLLDKDFTTDGYECSAGKMIELTGEKLKGCYLRTPKVIDGYSCKDGLSLHPSGKLRRCKVTEAKKVAEGIDVRPGDWVTLYDGGGIKRLELAAGPNKIQTLTCKGYLNFFHENGALKKCELAEDATIEGKRVSATSDAGAVYVCFDDKGKRVPDCNTLSGMTLE